jgi:hypothetical protein
MALSLQSRAKHANASVDAAAAPALTKQALEVSGGAAPFDVRVR